MSTENEMRILTIRKTDFTVRDDRLDDVKLIKTVNNIAPDGNGNVNIQVGGGEGSAIIDVLELPIENINKNAIYRLMTANWVQYQDLVEGGSVVYCVDTLPETGKVCADVSLSTFTGYYNVTDNTLYGYVDSMLGGAFGVPAGWYPFELLAQTAGLGFNGIITDIEDNPQNGYFGVLIGYDYYIYQDGWCKVPFVYEKAPEFDIKWDGVIGDRFALDVSALGYPNSFFVKMTDRVFANEELVGCFYTTNEGYEHTINEFDFSVDMFEGMISIDNGIVTVYDAELLNNALGAPSGYITNGTYFALITDGNGGVVQHTDRLVAPSKIIKMDSKYLDLSELHNVAKTGNYYDLNNRPEFYSDVVRYSITQHLNASQKQTARNNIDVYSKSEVDSKISSGGGSADLTGYATETWVKNQGYITAVPSEYVTETELNSKGYARTTELSGYAKKSEIPTKTSQLTNDLDYAKRSEIETMISEAIGVAIGGSY